MGSHLVQVQHTAGSEQSDLSDDEFSALEVQLIQSVEFSKGSPSSAGSHTPNMSNNVRGRLKQHVAFWERIEAPSFLLDTIREGYNPSAPLFYWIDIYGKRTSWRMAMTKIYLGTLYLKSTNSYILGKKAVSYSGFCELFKACFSTRVDITVYLNLEFQARNAQWERMLSPPRI